MTDEFQKKRCFFFRGKEGEGQRRGEKWEEMVCVLERERDTLAPLKQSGCSTVLRPLDIIQSFHHVKFPNMACRVCPAPLSPRRHIWASCPSTPLKEIIMFMSVLLQRPCGREGERLFPVSVSRTSLCMCGGVCAR